MIKKYLMENNGATLDHNGSIIEFNKGYMCSLRGSEQQFINIDDLIAALDNFKNNIKNIIYIGVWYNKGIWYLDNSIYYTNKRTALKNGKLNDQIAIFDWKNKKELIIK